MKLILEEKHVTLPVWSAVAAKAMLLQLSSAAAKRYFLFYQTALENSFKVYLYINCVEECVYMGNCTLVDD